MPALYISVAAVANHWGGKDAVVDQDEWAAILLGIAVVADYL
jgi:hypothetical protein